MKLFVGATLSVLFVLGSHAVIAQCDCIGFSKDIRGTRYATAYEELKHSDAVFWGQVVEVKKEPPRGGRDKFVQIKFRVEKAWRRDLGEFVTVREYTAGCLIGFETGERWLVYAELDENRIYRTEYCSRTRAASRNPEVDIKEFEKIGEQQTKIKKAPAR